VKRFVILIACLVVALGIAFAWRSRTTPPGPAADHPRVPAGARTVDISFFSPALGRTMQYRVVEPSEMTAAKLPVVFLLHGGGGTYWDWTNYSDVARFALSGLVLVMPDADESWYTNSASRPRDRYEDYIVQDLISDVRQRFPVLSARSATGAIGISMGGYGAIKIALHHPELFSFVGALSPAVDVPRRGFEPQRAAQWYHYRQIFGPGGSDTRVQNDLFRLISRRVDPRDAPFFYITCGEQEALLLPNREFVDDLRGRGFRFEFHEAEGGHNWQQWNAQLPGVFLALQSEIRPAQRH